MEDFVVLDDLDVLFRLKKRKWLVVKIFVLWKKIINLLLFCLVVLDLDGDELMEDVFLLMFIVQKWKYDFDSIDYDELQEMVVKVFLVVKKLLLIFKLKLKVYIQEFEKRYFWLVNILDGNKKLLIDLEFDFMFIYILLVVEKQFFVFEKQYWDIKKNFWDIVVFFKKGKFYELYENDVIIGYQLFDLKMIDCVNMCMVGVFESLFDMWVNQFVVKGFKVVCVDQMEFVFGKEMCECDVKVKKVDKII